MNEAVEGDTENISAAKEYIRALKSAEEIKTFKQQSQVMTHAERLEKVGKQMELYRDDNFIVKRGSGQDSQVKQQSEKPDYIRKYQEKLKQSGAKGGSLESRPKQGLVAEIDKKLMMQEGIQGGGYAPGQISSSLGVSNVVEYYTEI